MRGSYSSVPLRLLRAAMGFLPGALLLWTIATDPAIAGRLKQWLVTGLAVLLVAYAVRCATLAFVIDEHFLTVRNLLRTYTISRSSLLRATLDGEATVWAGPGRHGGGPRCLLLQTDGQMITATATAWLPRGKQVAALKQAAGIAAENRSRAGRRADRSP
jgi:hypothetical protein